MKLNNFSRESSRNGVSIPVLCLTNGQEMWLGNNCGSVHQAVFSHPPTRYVILGSLKWVKWVNKQQLPQSVKWKGWKMISKVLSSPSSLELNLQAALG